MTRCDLDYRCGGSVGIGLLRTDFPFYSAAFPLPSTSRGCEACTRSATLVKLCVEFVPSRKSRLNIPMLHNCHPLLSITYKWARRIAITVVGFTVLAGGIAMIVLPGPAIVVIPIGLGILGLEFAWARVWLKKIRERGTVFVQSMRRKRSPD